MDTMPELFILGVTGHIGGAVAHAIKARFPHVRIKGLVRDETKARRLREASPGMQKVLGDLADEGLIRAQSAAAGFVINSTPDWAPASHAAIKAALSGLASRPSRGFYVQTSGAFLVAERGHGDRASEKVWHDVEDIEQIINMPPGRCHQAAEQLVRSMAADVNIAIVSPAVVYGLSPSTEHPAPLTLRDIVRTVAQLATGFTMAQGRNIMGFVHVEDAADIYARLFADARQCAGAADSRLWGPHAYYFASAEELTFAQFMRILVTHLLRRGALAADGMIEIEPGSHLARHHLVKQVVEAHGCGANVRCRSARAEALLGWTPVARSFDDTLAEVLDCMLQR